MNIDINRILLVFVSLFANITNMVGKMTINEFFTFIVSILTIIYLITGIINNIQKNREYDRKAKKNIDNNIGNN